jgi:hypothetical protein
MGGVMTNEQKMKLAEMLFIRAEIAGRTLSKGAVQLMIEDLADLPFEAVARVLRDWGKVSAEFPHPAKVREKLKPQTDDSDDGRDIASRVIGAVGRFGSYQPEAARVAIGEIGWECVNRMGGWRTLCAELTEQTKGIMFAQLRDLAVTLKKKSMNGTIASPQNFPGMLPSGETRGIAPTVTKLIGSAFKD